MTTQFAECSVPVGVRTAVSWSLAAAVCLLSFSALLADDLPGSGQEIYVSLCASCHGANGEGVPDRCERPLQGAYELADLTQIVDETMPEDEPGGDGTLLDHTTVVWTNELGKGNSHTLNNIPFVIVGNGLGFRMGRSLQYDQVTHNRLLMALAHAFGHHHVETFGKPELCAGGVLPDSV
jgi:hypothetical protein